MVITMLKLRVAKQHRVILILLAIIFLIFGGILGSLFYFGNQAIAKQESESKANLAKLDQVISKIKAKKKAEAEAAKKAAEQKAASDAALSSQLQGNIVTPAGCAVKGAHGNPSQVDVVINKKRCFNPINFVPSDLVSVQGYMVSAKIQPDLVAMLQAAAAAGLPLGMTSSYRSYNNQVETYNHWVQTNGSTAAADTVSARPGYSEHQTGFAVDLDAGGCSLECFRGSATYQWMLVHAVEFGFIERYPAGLESVTGYSPEAWHWRYVGKATAQEMKTRGIKTLEQLWNLPGGGY